MKILEISSSNKADILAMAQTYQIHELVVEDCLHRDQRAKLDIYENYYFLVWFLYTDSKIYEIQLIVFKDVLILVPHENSPEGKNWKDYLKIVDFTSAEQAVYQILDRLTDLSRHALHDLFKIIDQFEENLFTQAVSPQKMLKIKKKLNQADLLLSHLPSVVQQIELVAPLNTDLKFKVRDLYDHCERMTRNIQAYKSQIHSTIELYWGLQANVTNKHIKRLTLLASISVPLTLWSSFWGMNFEIIPFKEPYMFYLALSLMILSVLGTYLYLRHKGYFKE